MGVRPQRAAPRQPAWWLVRNHPLGDETPGGGAVYQSAYPATRTDNATTRRTPPAFSRGPGARRTHRAPFVGAPLGVLPEQTSAAGDRSFSARHRRTMILSERLSIYEKLMRLDKPIGNLLLLWPTLWAQWLASNGRPDWLILWIFVMGVVLMRSAGCIINDYADRNFDPHVARTRERPLAAGKVSPKEALLLAAGLSLLAFLLILPLNILVLGLSFVALFLAASYPFTKRFFAIPQAYLGIAFGFGIPMGFAAQTGTVPALAWAILAGIGVKLGLGWAYYGGLLAAAGIAVYHYRLIRERKREGCFRAFLHNNWFGAAVFGGIALHYALA